MSYPTRPDTLLPLEDALQHMLTLLAEEDGATPLAKQETLAIAEAHGRILAEDVIAPMHQPPFANSMMDGYALRLADWRDADTPLPIHQRIAAGAAPRPLPERQAARIFTGAPLPPGADAVIMQERCREENGQVWISEAPSAQWINAIGQDVRQASRVMQRGSRLTPAHLAVLASLGIAHIKVVSQLQVAIVTTGDELVAPGSVPPNALPMGKIFNSNLTLLQTLLPCWGAAPPTLITLPDDRAETERCLANLATTHQLIITNGGASVGDADHVRAIMQAQQRLALWQLAIKPGKPFMFGRWQHDAGVCWMAGLPGNPVAAWVTAVLMVRPFMQALLGALPLASRNLAEVLPQALPARADFDWPKPDVKRREFLRVAAHVDWASGELQLQLMPNQKSAVMSSVISATGLLDNPIGNPIRRGDRCRYLPFSAFLS